MSGPGWQLAANISLLFRELPLLDRPAAAADAGFPAVEAWWPFATAAPAAQIEEFLARVDDAGVGLTGLNLFAGDMPAGERGLVSRPDRRREFEDNLEAVVGIAQATGLRGVNALYGQRRPDLDPAEQDRVGFENLVEATRRLGAVGTTVLLEPLSRGLNGDYPLETADQAMNLIERVRAAAGSDAIALLFDTFHLTNNGDDLLRVIRVHGPDIGHVQLADSPGRGVPGSGSVDFRAVLDALGTAGYDGVIAAEYVPADDTRAELTWVEGFPELRRAASR